jgi:DNA polymerase-3 subunit epsilon
MTYPESQPGALDVEEHVIALLGHPDFRLTRRFVPREYYHTDVPAVLHRGIILDTESTGTDIHVDKIIELGMIKFDYSPETGKVYRVVGTFDELEDPGMPIPAAAAAVNGLTDEMVAGKKIVDAEVEAFVEGVDLIIAHNSGYDRAMVERRFKGFDKVKWGCSQRQVDWTAEGIGSHKLDYIAYMLGFFFEGHRAVADCLALLEALQRTLPISRTTGLKQIIDNHAKVGRRIWALDAKFEKKDDLKKRGYSWGDGNNGTEKAWNLEVADEDFDAEIEWLKENVYFKRAFRAAIDVTTPLNRFSTRPGERQRIMFG